MLNRWSKAARPGHDPVHEREVISEDRLSRWRSRCAVGSNVQNSTSVFLILCCLFLLGAPVHATDYSVDFGAETEAGKDAGSIACSSEVICTAKMESLALSITFMVVRNEPQRVRIHMDSNNDPGCCYFSDGDRSISIDPHHPPSRMSFYRGIEAKGAMLIENERVGMLYLRFRSH
jgi:hypothetical protein